MLREIIKLKKRVLREEKEKLSPYLKREVRQLKFKKALSGKGISLIGEIKRASPSRGIIYQGEFNPSKIAQIYAQNSVSAISVLTEEKFFLGKLSYIEEVKNSVDLPVLMKDFILDEYQIDQGFKAGADCILLIVKLLSKRRLHQLFRFCKKLGLDALFEVHTRGELFRALDIGAELIGVNNRNLDNFKVDIETSFKLIKEIPTEIVAVSESGIKTREEIEALEKVGFNAVLIGEALLSSRNIEKKIRSLLEGK
jgi:indole-3-glycerol phosphate synthase